MRVIALLSVFDVHQCFEIFQDLICGSAKMTPLIAAIRISYRIVYMYSKYLLKKSMQSHNIVHSFPFVPFYLPLWSEHQNPLRWLSIFYQIQGEHSGNLAWVWILAQQLTKNPKPNKAVSWSVLSLLKNTYKNLSWG